MSDAVGFIFLGMVVAIIGGAIMALGGDSGLGLFIGVVIAALGTIFVQVGTIAAGVVIGNRASHTAAASRG